MYEDANERDEVDRMNNPYMNNKFEEGKQQEGAKKWLININFIQAIEYNKITK